MKVKFSIIVCLLFLVALSLTACGKKQEEKEEGGLMQIPNPFVDCKTLSEAAKLAGFDVTMPGKFDGYPTTMIQAIKDEMIQEIFFDGDPESESSNRILVRKAVGEDDISGDYNEYPENETVNMHGVDVLLRGEKGLIYCATWTADGYSYAIDADKGLTREAVEAAIQEMVTVAG